jgi:hypothetical protein
VENPFCQIGFRPAALHRLPESIAHIADALWMQALEEGKRRALRDRGRIICRAADASDRLLKSAIRIRRYCDE